MYIHIDLHNHSRSLHRRRRRLTPDDHSWRVLLRYWRRSRRSSEHWSHSQTAGPSTKRHSNVHLNKVKASRDQPIVRTYNLFQFFRLVLVISGELAQVHFQCRRCVFVDKVRLKFRTRLVCSIRSNPFECPFLQSQSVEIPANCPHVQSVSVSRLALVLSAQLAQFRLQCRRRIFVDEVKLKVGTHQAVHTFFSQPN
jgi:hypothetical protein